MKWKPYEAILNVLEKLFKHCFNPSYEMEALRRYYHSGGIRRGVCFNPSYEMEALRSLRLKSAISSILMSFNPSYEMEALRR